MPIIGFILAIVGSAIYGASVGIVLLALFSFQSAPGFTGLEVLAVPIFAIEAAIVGAAAALISLWLPRTSGRWSDSFVFLVAAAIAVQAFVSFVPILLIPLLPRDDLISLVNLSIAMSGPVDWPKGGFNRNWLATIPVTLAICSPWFRSRFDG